MTRDEERGRAWCKMKGYDYLDVNELGVWYGRVVLQDGRLTDTHGLGPWDTVEEDLATHAARPRA